MRWLHGWKGIAVILVLLAGVVWAKQRWPPLPADEPAVSSTVPTRNQYPFQLAPGVHVLGDISVANVTGLPYSDSFVYVIETSEGLVLIDSGGDPNCVGLRRQMQAANLDLRKIVAILLSHYHVDHILGVPRLREVSGAKVHAGRADAEVLRGEKSLETVYSIFPRTRVEVSPLTVDIELTEDQNLVFGDTVIRAITAPGHTAGSMCYLLDTPGRPRVLFGGDTTMMPGGVWGTYSTYLAPRFGGDATQFLATLKKLQEIPAPDFVAPGHAGNDPFLLDCAYDNTRWQRELQVGMTELVALQAELADRGGDYLDESPKQLLPELYYLGDFAGRGGYVWKTDRGLVFFDAPRAAAGEPDWKSRLSQAGLEGRPLAAVLLTSALPEASAGLSDLLAMANGPVFVPTSQLAEIGQRFPQAELRSVETVSTELPDLHLQVSILETFPHQPAVYQFVIAETSVVVTGDVLVKINDPTYQFIRSSTSALRTLSVEQLPLPTPLCDLLGQMATAPDRTTTYLLALPYSELELPAIWLPARPIHGQNANLRSGEWTANIDRNREVVERWLYYQAP